MYAMALILAMGLGGAGDTIPTQRIITTVWPDGQGRSGQVQRRCE
jgi:hypothetical protein